MRNVERALSKVCNVSRAAKILIVVIRRTFVRELHLRLGESHDMGLRVGLAVLTTRRLPCHLFLRIPILAILHHHTKRLSKHLIAFASVAAPALKSTNIRLTLPS